MDVKQAIIQCKAGNRAAYGKIVAAHGDRLVAILYNILGNLEDARDVAQETFVRAFKNLHRFDVEKPFEPWLYRIGRNLAYNYHRSSKRWPQGRGGIEDEPGLESMESETKTPLHRVWEDERRRNINKVLARMRPQYREVLTLRYMLKLEYDQIGARMSIPTGTVKTWLNRAKEQFRTMAEVKELF